MYATIPAVFTTNSLDEIKRSNYSAHKNTYDNTIIYIIIIIISNLFYDSLSKWTTNIYSLKS